MRAALLAATLGVVGLGAMSLRALWLGSEALAAADAAFDEGNLAESIRAARRAASLSVPGAPHVDAAYARLDVIARGAEAAGRTDLSILAWEATRAAALESDSPWFEERPELARANQNLARLRARASAEREPGRRGPTERELGRLLARSTRPGWTSTGLVALGFLLMTCGLGWSAARGIGKDGRVFGRALALGAALLVLGVACWTFAVYRA